jgi:arylsulfatase A-like enzyme
MDLYPTLAGLAGASAPSDRALDGHDIRALLFGEPGVTSPYEAFFYYHIRHLQAVRSGPWKLYLPRKQQGRSPAVDAERLYNLVEDPMETRNLIGQQPDVVKRLRDLIHRARQDLGDLDRPGANVRPVGRVERPSPQALRTKA